MNDVPLDRLGRRHAVDLRDQSYLAARSLDLERPREAEPRTFRYWYERFSQDQTGPTCVANTATHILGDSPRTWPLRWLDSIGERRDLRSNTGLRVYTTDYQSPTSGQRGFRGALYDEAQQVDEWDDTPPGGGTSFRAAAKVLQRWGFITSYLWLQNAYEVGQAILNHGPVALGCDWYEGMYYVNDGDLLHPTGSIVGGHEVALTGVNTQTNRVRVQTWGNRYYLPLTDLDQLLDNGDACLVTEPA